MVLSKISDGGDSVAACRGQGLNQELDCRWSYGKVQDITVQYFLLIRCGVGNPVCYSRFLDHAISLKFRWSWVGGYLLYGEILFCSRVPQYSRDWLYGSKQTGHVHD